MVKKIKKHNSFTLIELSVVITVLSLIFTTALVSYSRIQDINNAEKTYIKLKQIERALRTYYRVNDVLPCPADLTDSIKDSDFGDAEDATESCSTSASGVREIDQNNYYGGVPINALNLPKSYAFDEWGNKISYVVSKKMRIEYSDFEPSDLSSLSCWIDFNDNSTVLNGDTNEASIGENIATAIDKSSSVQDCDLEQSTDSNRPVYQSTPQGMKSADFQTNKVIHFKEGVAESLPHITGGLDFTYAVAYNIESDPGVINMRILYSDGNSSRLWHMANDAHRSGGTDLTATGVLNAPGDNIVIHIRDAANDLASSVGRVNFTNITETSVSDNEGGNNPRVGSTNSQYIWGNVYEIAVYDRQLSSGEVAKLEDYLNTKWFLLGNIIEDVDANVIEYNAQSLLISHGPTGVGAYNAAGNQIGTTTDGTFDDENIFESGQDQTFVTNEKNDRITGGWQKNFDDILIYQIEEDYIGSSEETAVPELPGLLCWIDASDAGTVETNSSGIPGADGELVESVSDKANSDDIDCNLSRQSTNHRPTYIHDLPFSGLNALEFDGNDDKLDFNDVPDSVEAGQDYTLFYVFSSKQDSGDEQNLFRKVSASSSNENFRLFSGGEILINENESANFGSIKYGSNLNYVTFVRTEDTVSSASKLNFENITSDLSVTSVSDSNGFKFSAESNALDGYLFELLIYDRVLSTEEIIAVENYLQNKWEMDIDDPSDLSDLTCWLDFSDSSSIETTSGSPATNGEDVVSITDKSEAINGIDTDLSNCSGTVAGYSFLTAPTFVTNKSPSGLSAIEFTDIDDGIELDTNGGASTKAVNAIESVDVDYTMFVAFGQYDDGRNPASIGGKILEGHGTADDLHVYAGEFAINDSSDTSRKIIGPLNNGEDAVNIVSYARDKATNDNILARSRVNGIEVGYDQGNTDVGGTNKRTLIGNGQAIGKALGGPIYEMIFYDRLLSGFEIAVIEDYLRNKWDISIIDSPKDISDLTCWLDFSDSSSMLAYGGGAVSNGGTIGTISDKSLGNTPDCTATSSGSGSSPTYTELSSISDLSSGVFDSGDSLSVNSLPILVDEDKDYTMIIASSAVNGDIDEVSVFNTTSSTENLVYLHNSIVTFDSSIIAPELEYWEGIGSMNINGEELNISIVGRDVVSPFESGSNQGIVSYSRINGVETGGYKEVDYSSSGSSVSSLGGQFVGNIYEIMFYDRILTSAEMKKIEKYLENKWGAVAVASPKEVSGLTCWIDFLDRQNILDSGLAVADDDDLIQQVNDRSYNGADCQLEQTNAARQPTLKDDASPGDMPGALFDIAGGNSGMDFATGSVSEMIGTSLNDYSFLAVTGPVISSNVRRILSGGVERSIRFNTNDELQMHDGTSAQNLTSDDRINNIDNTVNIVSLARQKDSPFYNGEAGPGIVNYSRFNNSYIDGFLSVPTTSTNSGNVVLGRDGSNTELDTHIHEFLFYDRLISKQELRKLESYLENKWAAKIKSPLEIDDIVYWIDFSDAATVEDSAADGEIENVINKAFFAHGDLIDTVQGTPGNRMLYRLNNPKTGLAGADSNSGRHIEVSNIPSALQNTTGYTYFIAFTYTNAVNPSRISIISNDELSVDSDGHLIIKNDGSSYLGTNITSSPSMSAGSTVQTVGIVRTTGEVNANTMINGVRRGSSVVVSDGGVNDRMIFGNSNLSNYGTRNPDGVYYEIIVYDRALNQEEMEKISRYLRDKWVD